MLTWAGEDDGGATLPEGVCLHLVRDPAAESNAEAEHELGAGCDAVRVEAALCWQRALARDVIRQKCFTLFSRAEPTRTLLIPEGKHTY